MYCSIEGVQVNVTGFFINLLSRKQKKGAYNTYIGRIVSLFFYHFDVLIEPATIDFKVLDIDMPMKNGGMIFHAG